MTWYTLSALPSDMPWYMLSPLKDVPSHVLGQVTVNEITNRSSQQ